MCGVCLFVGCCLSFSFTGVCLLVSVDCCWLPCVVFSLWLLIGVCCLFFVVWWLLVVVVLGVAVCCCSLLCVIPWCLLFVHC